jgi:cupin fold WbuC family metalloprotein
MSNRIPPPAPGEDLGLRLIDRTLMDAAGLQARDAARRRALLRYHELPEVVQRMINAIEPESYICPHRHLRPPHVEVFLALRGRGVLVRFDDAGAVVESVVLAAGGPVHGAEIPPGAWHTILALDPGTVFYEVKEGPYDPAADKEFAPWAPPEADLAGGRAYLADLRARLHLPTPVSHIPDLNTLDEEDDDLP